MKRQTKFALKLAVVGLASPGAFAQAVASGNEGPSLEEVVVTGRFIEEGAKSALKLDVPVRDVPFSVVTYSDAFIDAIDTTRVVELFNYMTGVQRAGNSGYDISIRGFSAGNGDRNAILINGLPGLATRAGSPPTVNVERVEVVKGPASVLYGRAQPGGFINLITKKPMDERKASIDLRASSYSGDKLSLGDAMGYQFSGDFTGPIDDGSRFLYRFVYELEDMESFRDYTGQEGVFVVPSLTWNVSDATSATLSLEYRSEKLAFDSGLAAPGFDIDLVAPITTRYQEPDDYQKEIGKSAALAVTHEFTPDVTWNLNLRSVTHDDTVVAFESGAVRPNRVTMSRRDRDQRNERQYHYIDNSLTLGFDTGGFGHKLLLGATAGRERSNFNRVRFFVGPPTMDIEIYNPVYGDTAPAVQPPQSWRESESDSFGLYATHMIELSDKWKAVAGIRYERDRQSTRELRLVAPSLATTTSDVLPMAGLLYQPNKAWSLYASYSTAFVPAPATAVSIDGSVLKPQTGQQYETGVKYESRDGRMNGTVSVFYIDKQDVLNSVGGGLFEQVGAEHAEGIELELNARPLENWQLTGGYAFVDAYITEDVIVQRIGTELPNAPRHSANIWSRYDFTSGLLQNFGIGIGANYRSGRLGALGLNPAAQRLNILELPSYSLVDLGIYYSQPKFDVTFKLSNLLDERYYESAFNEVRIMPGSPRAVSMTYRQRF